MVSSQEGLPNLLAVLSFNTPQAWKAVLQARLPATTRFVTVIGEFGDAPVGLGGLVRFMSLISWRGLR